MTHLIYFTFRGMSNFIKKFFPVKLSKYIYDKRITYFIKKRLYTHIIHNIKNIKLNKYMYNILLKKKTYIHTTHIRNN